MIKTKQSVAIAIALALLLGVPWGIQRKEGKQSAITTEGSLKPTLTHAQTVWTYALEWCESRGEIGAVNLKDRDGTPSYYSFQFKPSTFRLYGEKYGVIPKGLSDIQLSDKLKDYTLQRAIVEAMVLHSDEINWKQQFPECVRKNGPPPKSILPHSPTR